MSSELLRLENVNLQLDSFQLSHINIDLFEHEIHVIMGENGAGKSVLMQVISGLVTPDSGSIYIKNKLIRNRMVSGEMFDDVIYIRQDATMLLQLSVAENLFFNKLPYKNKFLKSIDYDKLNYMCQQLIDELGLPVSVFDRVETLGFAQRQIIEFCRAYISEASIVILDEPSSALTQSERNLLYRIVSKIKSKGSGVFYITHCLEDVSLIGDRVTVIKNGSIIGTRIVADCPEEEKIGRAHV
jgi:ribose transport system ATP-binding protein